MRQIAFTILLTLAGFTLAAQDTQLYRKGSNGYVLSIPYTKTEEKKTNQTDDEKGKDDSSFGKKESDQSNVADQPAGNEEALVVEEETMEIVIEDEGLQTGLEESDIEIIVEEGSGEENAAGQEEPAGDEEASTAEEETIEIVIEDETDASETAEEFISEEDEEEPAEESEAVQETVRVQEAPKPIFREPVVIDESKVVKTATVEEIKNNTEHYSTVFIEGELTLQLSDREFILTDSTGAIKVELTREAEFFMNDAVLLGSTVKVLAVVKKRIWSDVVIEGLKAKIVIPSVVGDEFTAEVLRTQEPDSGAQTDEEEETGAVESGLDGLDQREEEVPQPYEQEEEGAAVVSEAQETELDDMADDEAAAGAYEDSLGQTEEGADIAADAETDKIDNEAAEAGDEADIQAE